jgi:hypothetical protein
MCKYTKERKRQLGMNPSTASNRLNKQLLFTLGKKLDMQWCFHCGAEIESVKEMSVEHKIPWLYSEDPVSLYFDLDNIAFSHKSCNYGAARKPTKKFCPSPSSYKRGCRCDGCKKCYSDYRKELRAKS